MSNIINGYKVVDIHTKAVVTEYAVDKKKYARSFAEKKNLEYGAHRYTVIPF